MEATTATLLALGAAAGWGTSDFLGGARSRTSGLLPVLAVSQTASGVLLLIVLAVTGAAPPPAGYLIVGVASGLCELVGVAALYRGLAVGPAGLVAPTAAVSPAVPVLVGVAFGERPTLLRGAGLVLLVGGLVLAARSSGDGPSGTAARAGLGFGVLAALGFGGSFVFTDLASAGGVVWALLTARLTAVGARVVHGERSGTIRRVGIALTLVGLVATTTF